MHVFDTERYGRINIQLEYLIVVLRSGNWCAINGEIINKHQIG